MSIDDDHNDYSFDFFLLIFDFWLPKITQVNGHKVYLLNGNIVIIEEEKKINQKFNRKKKVIVVVGCYVT